MGTTVGRLAAGALALALASSSSLAAERATAPEEARAVAAELRALLRDLERASRAADGASRRWMSLRLREMELRAAEAAARDAFEDRARSAYMTGPGRAIEMVLGAADLHDLATRLPYASTALAAQRLDVRSLAAARAALGDGLRAAEDAQRFLMRSEDRLAAIRATIERRLATARAAAAKTSDRDALSAIRELHKRYAGTVQRVSGATRTIRYRRGEAMFAEASPYLGPRPDCTIPKGLRSTGDQIAGEASWYGDEFRNKPTASGATYIPERFTVAHRTLPFGLYLLIRFRSRCVVAFLNDRGPYVNGRILDLSAGSARAVGLTGVQDVHATLLVRAR